MSSSKTGSHVIPNLLAKQILEEKAFYDRICVGL